MITGAVLNGTTGRLIAPAVARTATWRDRIRGLQGRRIADTEGLWIAPAAQVHTRGCLLPLLVVHCDAANRVLGWAVLPPGAVGPRLRGTRQIVELHPAHADAIRPGDLLLFWPDPARVREAGRACPS